MTQKRNRIKKFGKKQWEQHMETFGLTNNYFKEGRKLAKIFNVPEHFEDCYIIEFTNGNVDLFVIEGGYDIYKIKRLDFNKQHIHIYELRNKTQEEKKELIKQHKNILKDITIEDFRNKELEEILG